MNGLRERLIVTGRRWWCQVRGRHAPLPVFEAGRMYLRCWSCRLRTEGIVVYEES